MARSVLQSCVEGQLFDLSSQIEVLGARFEVSRFLFGMFQGAPRKSETSFVNQLLILFDKCRS